MPLSQENASQRMVSSACMRSLALLVRLADMQGHLPAGCTAVWSGLKTSDGKASKSNISTDAHLIRLDCRWDEVLRTSEPGAMEIVSANLGVLLSGPILAAAQEPQPLEPPTPDASQALHPHDLEDNNNDNDDGDEEWAVAVKGAIARAAAVLDDAQRDVGQDSPAEERGEDVDVDNGGDDEDEIRIGGLSAVGNPSVPRDRGQQDDKAGGAVDMLDVNDLDDGNVKAAAAADAGPSTGSAPFVSHVFPKHGEPVSISCLPTAGGARGAPSSTGAPAGGLSGRGAAVTPAATVARVSGGRMAVSVTDSPGGSSSGGLAAATTFPRAFDGVSAVGHPVVGSGSAASSAAAGVSVRGGAALGGVAASLSAADRAAFGARAVAAKNHGKKKAVPTQPTPAKPKNKRAELTEEMTGRQAAEAAAAADKVVIVNTRTMPPRTPYVVEQVAPNCIWPDCGINDVG